MRSFRENIGIHFFYVVLILSLAIILLVTFNWTAIDGFVAYIGVASGITSLVLGVLAIIYSFYSTYAFSASAQVISSNSERVAKVGVELGNVLETSRSLQGRAEERTDSLHELIMEMRSGLSSLHETTKNIEGSVAGIPEKISALQKASANEASPSLDSDRNGVVQWNDAEVERFLRTTSINGVAGLMAAEIAREKGECADLVEMFGAEKAEYMWGFQVAAVSVGLVHLEGVNGQFAKRSVRFKAASDRVVQPLSFANMEKSLKRKASRGDEGRKRAATLIQTKLQEYRSS